MTMGIDKTLNMARQLKNHFKVFEELEDFLQSAVSLQKVTKEFEARKAALEGDIVFLKDKKAEILTATATLKEKKLAEFEKMSKDEDENLRLHKVEVEAEIKIMESQRDAAKSNVEEAVKTHDLEMERIKSETDQANQILKAVQAKIQYIKAKLE